MWELNQLLPLHWAGWAVAIAPIHAIINAKTPTEEEIITERWKESTLSTLTTVIYIGAILSAVTVGAFTWPQLQNGTSVAFSMIQTLWYSSLIFSVTAVCIGLCQCVFLARISGATNGNLLLRELLIESRPNGTRKPRSSQSLVWLLAVGLLEWSVYLWLGGFLVFLWEVTNMRKAEQKKGDIAVAVICGTAFLCAVSSYVLSMVELWYRVWKNRKLLETGAMGTTIP